MNKVVTCCKNCPLLGVAEDEYTCEHPIPTKTNLNLPDAVKNLPTDCQLLKENLTIQAELNYKDYDDFKNRGFNNFPGLNCNSGVYNADEIREMFVPLFKIATKLSKEYYDKENWPYDDGTIILEKDYPIFDETFNNFYNLKKINIYNGSTFIFLLKSIRDAINSDFYPILLDFNVGGLNISQTEFMLTCAKF